MRALFPVRREIFLDSGQPHCPPPNRNLADVHCGMGGKDVEDGMAYRGELASKNTNEPDAVETRIPIPKTLEYPFESRLATTANAGTKKTKKSSIKPSCQDCLATHKPAPPATAIVAANSQRIENWNRFAMRPDYQGIIKMEIDNGLRPAHTAHAPARRSTVRPTPLATLGQPIGLNHLDDPARSIKPDDRLALDHDHG